MNDNASTECFWDFAVRTYRTDAVPAACLALQDRAGVDVNMLLFCCWVGSYLGKFEVKLFEQALEFSERWASNVVKPLRAARTWMKQVGCAENGVPFTDCMQLRDEIKAAEFSAEKMQEEVLEKYAKKFERHGVTEEESMSAVVDNLTRYAQVADIELSDEVRAGLAVIVQAAFPHWNDGALADKLHHGLDAVSSR